MGLLETGSIEATITESERPASSPLESPPINRIFTLSLPSHFGMATAGVLGLSGRFESGFEADESLDEAVEMLLAK